MFFRDRQVVITLKVEEPATDLPERRIVLNFDKVRLPIGRSSSKIAAVSPKADNAFFENPVMSRVHAELFADLRYLRVYLKDARSSHGTMINDIKLDPVVQHPVKDGDLLTFGVAIRNGSEVVHPIKARIGLKFRKIKLTREHMQGTFMVPDEDSEYESEPTDLIGRAVEIIKRCGPEPFIDLTQETTLRPVETQKQEEEVSHEEVGEDDQAGEENEAPDEHQTEEQQEDIEREEVGEQDESPEHETEERGEEDETMLDGISEIPDNEEVAYEISAVEETVQDLIIETVDNDATDPVNEDAMTEPVIEDLDLPPSSASPVVDAETTLVDLDEVNEPSQDASPSSPPTPSKKRKAEEISTDEVEDAVALPPLLISEPLPVLPEPIVAIPLDNEQEESRPVKRFQGTAGKVGYAALGTLVGGIAIFTTLVASGPTF